ncbi:MAG: helix-turn-helix transcriptional regulator [Acidobacteriota bacterium]
MASQTGPRAKSPLSSRRTSLGLTQAQVAARSGLSPSMISRIEKGDRPRVLVDTLQKIAIGYQVSLEKAQVLLEATVRAAVARAEKKS